MQRHCFIAFVNRSDFNQMVILTLRTLQKIVSFAPDLCLCYEMACSSTTQHSIRNVVRVVTNFYRKSLFFTTSSQTTDNNPETYDVGLCCMSQLIEVEPDKVKCICYFFTYFNTLHFAYNPACQPERHRKNHLMLGRAC